MITVGMNYKVIPGKEETFEKACTGVINAMQGMDGHQESFLFNDVNNKQTYLIISDWSDKDAFDAFIASDQFKKVTNWGSEQILAGRPAHQVYQK